MWAMNGAFYLIGYCGLRQDIRVFALDRIRRLELTPEPFDLPEDVIIVWPDGAIR
jgi:predicted DNA-binding transcriptional regulator YafY